ncbi:FAD-dependent monooxygenase [Chelatococcus sp. GCM10030263]|uniref:FAD-dependent monooxygenase n=1 Tax=Chelatococcus sp. GCM10030263 TaxID=3273387 RepID=UPI003609680C
MGDGSATAPDVAVVGAGPVGLAGAIALARRGLSVTLVGRPEAGAAGRTVALLDGSVRFLAAIGAWDDERLGQAPLADLSIVDDTGSLFRLPPVTFHCTELDLPAFGYNVENAALVDYLLEVAAGCPSLTLARTLATGMTIADDRAQVTLDDGSRIAARLVVAADGRKSPMRTAAGIGVRSRSHRQVAITAILAHDRPHRDRSTEFHTRQGPFTLVPLPGRRSSLVWVCGKAQAERIAALDDIAFARAVEGQAKSMLGAMRLDGPRGAFPLATTTAERLVAERLVLVGEAAHVLPPIGAQGLNLGLRDIAVLCDVLAAAEGEDPGAGRLLARYADRRAGDLATRRGAIDLLNRSLLADFPPVDLGRGVALLALAQIAPLRRLVMREGLRPSLFPPHLPKVWRPREPKAGRVEKS